MDDFVQEMAQYEYLLVFHDARKRNDFQNNEVTTHVNSGSSERGETCSWRVKKFPGTRPHRSRCFGR
jgi:hypothetical protein